MHCCSKLRQRRSRRPFDTAFNQQRLPAWQPIMTARAVLPVFFIIGLVFLPLGVIFFLMNTSDEHVFEYTNCEQNGTICSDFLENNISGSCKCEIEFTLNHDLNGDVYMFYALTKLFQNHRLYVKSRDDTQLLGKLSEDVDSACKPFHKTDDGKPIAPCGAIANSLFNDTITLAKKSDNGETEQIRLLNTGIAWPVDKNVRFQNPDGDLKEALQDFAKPINWNRNLYELDPDNPDNNGFRNEDFIIWMRPAAFDSFQKLYRRIDQDDGLKAGDYILNIDYHYPVKPFDGTKSVILTTTSFVGGRNQFPAIALMVMGCLFMILGGILLFLHIRWKQRNDYLTSINPNTGLSSAAGLRPSIDSNLTY